MNENDSQALTAFLAKIILAFIFAKLIIEFSLGFWWIFLFILLT